MWVMHSSRNRFEWMLLQQILLGWRLSKEILPEQMLNIPQSDGDVQLVHLPQLMIGEEEQLAQQL